MTGRRRTPLQRAESRHAAEPELDTDEFRNMMRRRQDAEEKLKRHLEGERDGRAIPPEELTDRPADPGAASASTTPTTPEDPGQSSEK